MTVVKRKFGNDEREERLRKGNIWKTNRERKKKKGILIAVGKKKERHDDPRHRNVERKGTRNKGKGVWEKKRKTERRNE